jgi:cell division protein FtsB
MEFDSAKSLRRTVLLTTLAATLVAGILAWRGRQLGDILDEQARLEAQLARLKRENAQARTERNALLSSPEAIERVAREEYGFAAPGEKVTEFASPPVLLRAEPPVNVAVPAWQKALMWPFLPLALPAMVFLTTAFVLSWLQVAARARFGRAA